MSTLTLKWEAEAKAKAAKAAKKKAKRNSKGQYIKQEPTEES
mgnify:FL=1|tara:strand:- start:345 stop:470 length:126 start_codon:yes stop_codon:yes gene_type:complete